MILRRWFIRTLVPLAGGLLIAAGAARADEIHVMTSGGFTAAYDELRPIYEKATGDTLHTAYGSSMGGGPESIPVRLDRGEPADILILASTALDELIKQGRVVPGSRVDLVRSLIGMSVRKGAPKPDISTVDALKRTLLEAKSVAYSASASGTYIAAEMFPALGLAEAMKDKAKRIVTERVAAVVARGEAEIGFQQVSELLPVEGADFVGTLPESVQRATIFSAGIATGAKQPEAAKKLIAFFLSPEAAPTIEKTGLEPLGRK